MSPPNSASRALSTGRRAFGKSHHSAWPTALQCRSSQALAKRNIKHETSLRDDGDNIASMAWNLHAIEQAQLRKHVASMAWGAHSHLVDLVAGWKPQGRKILRASLSLSKSNWGVQFSSSNAPRRGPASGPRRLVAYFVGGEQLGPGIQWISWPRNKQLTLPSCAGCRFRFGIHLLSNRTRPPRRTTRPFPQINVVQASPTSRLGKACHFAARPQSSSVGEQTLGQPISKNLRRCGFPSFKAQW